MPLSSIIKHLENHRLTGELIKRCDRENRLRINEGSKTAKALISTAIARKEKRPLLVIVPTIEEATRWLSLLEIMGWQNPLIYPSSESSPYDSDDPTSEIVWGQLQVLSELISEDNISNKAIVATERALQPHLPHINYLKTQCIDLRQGIEINLESITKELAQLGYIRTGSVDQEGTWSRRGDILDIYPVSSEYPIRIELYGDEIDKLREFDPISQRSLDSIEYIVITPTGFNSLICNELRKNTPNDLDKVIDDEQLNILLEGNSIEGMTRFMGSIWNKPASLIDYFPKNTCTVIDERDQIIAHSNQWLGHIQENYIDIKKQLEQETPEFTELIPKVLDKPIEETLKNLDCYFGFDLEELSSSNNIHNTFSLSSRSINSYPKQFGKLAELVKNYQKSKNAIWIISSQPTRVVSLLEEHDCYSKFIPNNYDHISIERLIEQNTPASLKTNGLSELEGLELQPWKITIITDREFFGQQSLNSTGYIRRRRGAASNKVNPNKMQPGDFVVHRNHGIGRFIKIEKLVINFEARDYIVVQYLDGILRVAADQLSSLGRYRSSNSQKPTINKMGGSAWFKTKEKARKGVKRIALDLIKLYAERSECKGYSYPKDGPWQIELEDSFPYEATPDQIKAVKEVKKDMEDSKPMDRLVCGDVGFGKTEVAVRAIFKAITAGKQIALLAPTTILAQQHWRTLTDRFAPYPIKISLLNRFRTAKEKKVILEGLIEGTIDAVIGTHQLLGKNIKFKNLGLLIVDEEQRFGVNQKEKIKAIKKDLDVLTLSATPIPRTLYMSLSGVREMSLITTPPPQRRPIKTHLSPLDYQTVRSAISQEIERGGQVFYVVPRIEGIEKISEKIKQSLPSLKILIAHGQMPEGELENTMIAFNNGEADLLLCTTIVESGLDIPTVNTILIEDSQKLGLSQLYQLRGRVGRSGVQAHAWLFYPSEENLSDSAKQRLRAIKEFAQLGSGYQLAIRDMEIRGVGNLLGVEQTGQIETVGFDLYMEMLQECLAEIRGQEIPTVEDTQIDLQITAFIPGDWILDSQEKISAYKSATECSSFPDLLDLASAWIERYGSLPGPVECLLEIMKLKILAKKCGFSRIQLQKPNVILETPMEESAFRLLRKGLPSHLHQRLIYKSAKGMTAKVTARGIGALSNEMQLGTLIDWLTQMSTQLSLTNNNSLETEQTELSSDSEGIKK